MDRRRFFTVLGGTGLAVVSAPLFIPAERLDFGVPRPALVLPTYEEVAKITIGAWTYTAVSVESADNYIREIWLKHVIPAREQQMVFTQLVNRTYEREIALSLRA